MPHPEGLSEMRANIKSLAAAKVMISRITPLNLPVYAEHGWVVFRG